MTADKEVEFHNRLKLLRAERSVSRKELAQAVRCAPADDWLHRTAPVQLEPVPGFSPGQLFRAVAGCCILIRSIQSTQQ